MTNQEYAIYRNELFTMIKAAPEALGDDIIQLLSIPQATIVTEEYLEAPVKVMIMGQETYNEELSLRDLYRADGHHDEVAFESYFKAYQASFKDFDFGERYPHLPFWKAWNEVVELFELPSRRSIVWSNLSKVQLLRARKESYSVAKLPSAKAAPVVRWQKHLARAELNLVRPNIIIMFTSDNTWMAEHMYGDKGFNSDRQVSFAQIPDLPETTRRVIIPDHPNVMAVATYHPNVRPQYKAKAMAERKIMFDTLKAASTRLIPATSS
ncbi:hypothetical protein DXU03_31180 [Rhizobium johnstonii]